MAVIIKKNLEYNAEVCICYTDYESAFDQVDWTKLITILQNSGINAQRSHKITVFTVIMNP